MQMAVSMTEAAAERVRQFMRQRDGAVALRFGVRTTGCSGFAYIVDLTDGIEDDDHVFESNGVKIAVDPRSLPYVEGTCIDFGRDGFNEGFKYINPNVRSTCGCGESFGT